MDLTSHDGTVRDVTFMEGENGCNTTLISAGAGNCKIYVTDCNTGTATQVLGGHTGHVYGLHTWGETRQRFFYSLLHDNIHVPGYIHVSVT